MLASPGLLRADIGSGAPPAASASPSASPTATPGPAISPASSPSPAAASSSPGPAASPAASGSSAAATPTPVPPPITTPHFTVVSAPRLIVLLPDPPPGWSSDKPDGASADSGGFMITTVSCVYVQGDADDAPTATVNIIDSANNQQFQDATRAMWNATSNTPDGYDKPVVVSGLPGFEHYHNADQTGALWAIVGGRYFVQIETTRQKPADLEAWLGRIDLKKLAALR